MIKWGTFGQHIWGTQGQFKKKIGSTMNFILFQSCFKVFDSLLFDFIAGFQVGFL
jgi:hypothetical protein